MSLACGAIAWPSGMLEIAVSAASVCPSAMSTQARSIQSMGVGSRRRASRVTAARASAIRSAWRLSWPLAHTRSGFRSRPVARSERPAIDSPSPSARIDRVRDGGRKVRGRNLTVDVLAVRSSRPPRWVRDPPVGEGRRSRSSPVHQDGGSWSEGDYSKGSADFRRVDDRAVDVSRRDREVNLCVSPGVRASWCSTARLASSRRARRRCR